MQKVVFFLSLLFLAASHASVAMAAPPDTPTIRILLAFDREESSDGLCVFHDIKSMEPEYSDNPVELGCTDEQLGYLHNNGSVFYLSLFTDQDSGQNMLDEILVAGLDCGCELGFYSGYNYGLCEFLLYSEGSDEPREADLICSEEQRKFYSGLASDELVRVYYYEFTVEDEGELLFLSSIESAERYGEDEGYEGQYDEEEDYEGEYDLLEITAAFGARESHEKTCVFYLNDDETIELACTDEQMRELMDLAGEDQDYERYTVWHGVNGILSHYEPLVLPHSDIPFEVESVMGFTGRFMHYEDGRCYFYDVHNEQKRDLYCTKAQAKALQADTGSRYFVAEDGGYVSSVEKVPANQQ